MRSQSQKTTPLDAIYVKCPEYAHPETESGCLDGAFGMKWGVSANRDEVSF